MKTVLNKSVPAWVKDDLAQMSQSRGWGFLQYLQNESGEVISIYDVINDPRLASVWESLGKAKMQKDGLRLNMILRGINYGLLPYLKWDKISSNSRIAKAKRVRLLTDKLKSELSPYFDNGKSLRSPSSELHAYGALSYLTADMSVEFARHVMREERNSDVAKAFKTADEEASYIYDEILRSANWYAINRLPDILDAICQGLDDHAERRPEIYRPSDPNANRTKFAKRMTRFFETTFGRPFREETWAITSIFYDVGNLDSSYLSKIAKTRKPARKS